MNIKRLDAECGTEGCVTFYEQREGDYVLFSDHEDFVNELVDEIKDLRKEYESLCDKIKTLYMETP